MSWSAVIAIVSWASTSVGLTLGALIAGYLFDHYVGDTLRDGMFMAIGAAFMMLNCWRAGWRP